MFLSLSNRVVWCINHLLSKRASLKIWKEKWRNFKKKLFQRTQSDWPKKRKNWEFNLLRDFRKSFFTSNVNCSNYFTAQKGFILIVLPWNRLISRTILLGDESPERFFRILVFQSFIDFNFCAYLKRLQKRKFKEVNAIQL